ncbi:MAG: HAMP domain-containing sensor histidine kinase [Nitrososphaeraceae archaeon]
MKQEIENRVLTIAKEQQQVLTQQTGIYPSLTELEMKQYLGKVLKEIKVLNNVDEILKKGRDILEKSLDYMVCSKFGSLRLVYNNYFDLYEKVMTTKYKNMQHKGIRLVTSIDTDSAELVKKFVSKGIRIRHVRNMPPIDFALSDKEMIATIQKTEGGYEIQNLLVSNEPAYMKHFVSIFEELWNGGIEANERINAIEQGIESEFLEVISDREKVSQILFDLSKSVKKEALLLLPNDISMLRMEKLGVINCLINASTKISASVKIICPMSSKNSDIIQHISDNAPNVKILNGANSSSGMFIVDSIKFLRAELKDPDAQDFSQAIGFSIYSNSRKSVESFKSIFELLWEQTELSEKLRKANLLFEIANEQLKTRDKQQQEFINIAAHELRTPIQPILGLTEVALSRTSDKEQAELLGIVNRNARRLRDLTEDLLDVTRIESQSLKLTKERVELNEILQSAATDFQNHLAKLHDNNGNVAFTCRMKENVFVQADKRRITQVISNLLSNAIKFIDHEGGSIQIITEMANIEEHFSNSHIVVAIKDTGKGIDPEIMPKLFSKFSTNSQHGTGLGLYISKNIVEAHGGRIWARNNEDGIGACFYFTLPIAS